MPHSQEKQSNGQYKASDLKPVWDKLDEHTSSISHLNEKMAGQQVEIKGLESRMEELSRVQQESRLESRQNYIALNEKLNNIDKQQVETKTTIKNTGYIISLIIAAPVLWQLIQYFFLTGSSGG